MTSEMRAVVATGSGSLEVRRVPTPDVSSGALVQIDQAAICGTDVKILAGHIPVDHPRIMGHEMAGEVIRSAESGAIPVGTRVLINPGVFCNRCDLCRRDLRQLCRNGGLLGRDIDGVFTEQIEIDEDFLHVIPQSVSRDAATLLQVLGTVVHAQRSVSVFPNETAVVVGLGVTGLLHLQMLAARGVTVIGVTRSQWKLDLATDLGASYTATPDMAADLVSQVTDGRGADLVVESVGTERTLAQSIELAGHGANIVVYGTVTGGKEGLPYYQLYFKELTLHNPRAAGPGDNDIGISLAAAGTLQLEPLVTARFPLEDAAKAFEAVGGQNLKVALDIGGSA